MRNCRHFFAVVILAAGSATAGAQVVVPPVNMGGTSFLDGVAGPGMLIEPLVVEHYRARRFVDAHGASVPGRNSIDTWSNLFHIALLTPHQILGGFYGAEVLVPFASIDIDTDFGPKASRSGVGDILVSPLIIEWPNRTLFGKKYFSRMSVLAVLPTGAYSANEPVNVGSNAGGAFAYYAFTIFPQPKLETSWRINYLWNARNANPFATLRTSSTQAGQAVHANFAVSYEISPSFRVGANGYALQQLTEHRMGGAAMTSSKERVIALGPGVVWSRSFWSLFGNLDFEAAARNRPQGSRLNITLRRVIPHAASGHP